MTVPQIEDVRPILRDFEFRLWKVLDDSWNEDWLQIPENLRRIMDSTTRANNLFSFVRQRALTEFHGDSEIHVVPFGRTVRFLFRDRVLVRLKRANPKTGLGSNIPTQATLEFINHPQMQLFSGLEVSHVDVLYKEDTFATRIESIAVTCRLGFTKVWSYDIDRPAAAGGMVIPMPPQTGGDGSPPPPVVRPRDQADQSDTDKPQQ
jgi:hypothetical protein